MQIPAKNQPKCPKWLIIPFLFFIKASGATIIIPAIQSGTYKL